VQEWLRKDLVTAAESLSFMAAMASKRQGRGVIQTMYETMYKESFQRNVPRVGELPALGSTWLLSPNAGLPSVPADLGNAEQPYPPTNAGDAFKTAKTTYLIVKVRGGAATASAPRAYYGSRQKT
jgi:hypothetical protein